uniref:Nudix hydrolase domain-containing protein n=1 Tax=Entomoneis paludosa TaxID=265537 RepID=A0A6U3BK40_9STRA
MDPPAPFHPTATRRVRTTVRVGVGVIVAVPDQPGHVYAGIRKGSHGSGTLALPGGHLELYESWTDCAKREVLEEMNIELADDLHLAHVTNDIMREEEKHYVTLFMMGKPAEGSSAPQNMEPEKCEGWEPYSWTKLKSLLAMGVGIEEGTPRLFGPLKKLVQEEPEAVMKYIQASSSTSA